MKECVDNNTVDIKARKFKNNELMQKQCEIVDKFFLSAQD